MSKIKNNPALGDWDELEKELFTPEEIAENDMRGELSWALCQARDAGKVTVEELQEIEDIYEPAFWLEAVVKKLISLGMTLKVVPIEQADAEQNKEAAPMEQNKEVVPMEQDKAS